MNSRNKKESQHNFFTSLSFNIIIPVIIMTWLSSEDYFGPFWGLVIALVFPISYGLYDLLKHRVFNFFSILGFISIFLTGGIGLLKLSKESMIAKETLMPLIMGLAVIISVYTRYPIVEILFRQILDINKIMDAFKKNNELHLFKKQMHISSLLFGFSFFISSILNYYVAIITLTGEPGTVEFNESLGKMTALSFPLVSIPMMLVTIIILLQFFRSITKHTNLNIEELIKN